MTAALLYGYLTGWVVTSVVATLLASRLQDQRDPAAHPRLLSLVAGAVWPLLILAVAQAGAFSLAAGVGHDDTPRLSLVT